MAKRSPYVLGHWATSSEDTLRNNFPVHRACRDGDVEELRRLLTSGNYGVESEDPFYGWAPAHWSAYFDKLDCLMMVLRFGSGDGNKITNTMTNFSVDLPTKQFGQTPLHVATFAGNPECVKWLLQCGANKDKVDYLGETSLHKAARTGTLACAKLLAAHAAAYAIRNNNGQLPKDLARACGHPSIADYLRQVEEATTPKASLPPAEDAMEATMEDDAMESVSPDVAGAVPETTPANDVLSDGAVAANIVPIGGRKRSRQEREESASKRFRTDYHPGSDQVPNLSFLFREPNGSNNVSNVPATHLVQSGSFTSVPVVSRVDDVPNPAHFEGRPLFYSPVTGAQRQHRHDSPEVANVCVAMDEEEMANESVDAGVKPRSSNSCPRLYDRYPGSLEFGHRGVAVANQSSTAVVGKSHCFLSSSNHYNNGGSPAHRNRSSTIANAVAASGWTEHCSSVLQEQDYCANYSQLMGDEMFKNIHGC